MSTPSDDSRHHVDPTMPAFGAGSGPQASPGSGGPAYGAPGTGAPGYGGSAHGAPGYGEPGYGAPGQPQYTPGSANPYPPAAPMPPTTPFSSGGGYDPNAPYQPNPPYGQPVSGGPAPFGQAPPPADPYAQPAAPFTQPAPPYGGQPAAPFGQPAPVGQPAPAYYPGQPNPYAAPPPNKSRGGLIAAVIIGVVVLLLAGIGALVLLSNDDKKPEASPTATTTTTPGGDTSTPTPGDTTTTPSDDETHSGNLKPYALPFPAGSDRWAKSAAEETLDLKAVAAFSTDPSASSRTLTECDFRDGFIRRWITNPEDTFVSVRLLRFGSTDDAADYLDRYIDSNSGGDWGNPIKVPGASNGSAFVATKPEKDGYTSSLAAGAKGDIVVIVVADQKRFPTSSVPGRLLVDQLGKL